MYKEIRKDLCLFWGCDTLKFPSIVLVYDFELSYFMYQNFVILQAKNIYKVCSAE